MRRRDLLIALGLSPAAGATLVRTCLGMQDEGGEQDESQDKEGAEKMVELLFVQTAHEASLGDGKLTLSGITPATLFFSDRPERIVGHIPTVRFVESWGLGHDCFAGDPPNAALSLLSGDKEEEIVVVLQNPRLEKDRLVYDVEILEGAETAAGGPCSLFIDTFGRPMTPRSLGGHVRRVHRRRRRRTFRRRR